jgi:hypothetical protein
VRPDAVVSTGNYDFTLAAGSAAIDAGTVPPGVTDGFTGTAPDLGALESGRVGPAYGPRPLSDHPYVGAPTQPASPDPARHRTVAIRSGGCYRASDAGQLMSSSSDDSLSGG